MKRFDQINVIPFIDIMLVLLAIVLTTATFIANGTIPLALPKTGDRLEHPAGAPREIVVTRGGELFLDGQATTLDELTAALSDVPRDTLLTLKVDANAPFQAFITVINRLKATHFARVSIVAEESG